MNVIEKCDYRNRCYKTKDDKRHNTVFTSPLNISRERWEQIFGITEEERIKRLNEWKKSRESHRTVEVSNTPHLSLWDSEWTVLSTGKRMSKKELKEYCRTRGKIWENE